MSKSFNIKEYQNFLIKAYQLADNIHVEFDSVFNDISTISNGKFAQLYNSIIDIKNDIDNTSPYTCIILNKSYSVYEYLSQINNWEDFSSMDESSEMSIWSITFVKDDMPIATIVSHYRSYDNCFYFIRNNIIQ